jgi:Sugar (and other) transporter
MALFIALCPDSPYYLITKGERDDAFISLSFLRGKCDNDVNEEFDELKASVDQSLKHSSSVLDIFLNRANRKGK